MDDLRRELGFPPCEQAQRLDAKDENAKRNAKRVLRALTLGSYEREEACWSLTPLDLLRTRGEGNGLVAFLDEVEKQLVPACGGK